MPAHPDTIDDDTDIEESTVIDPELRLRTVRTAASTIAESIETEARRVKRRQTKRKGKRNLFRRKSDKKEQDVDSGTGAGAGAQQTGTVAADTVKATKIKGERRNIYVNQSLPLGELDQNGDPISRYCRNKIRTSKYTILSFVPKNLFEQFRRVANLYFLALVIIQIFPMFGSTTPQIAMLPLVFILTVTAIKDGIEDYRRASLDNEVNNSAATKLGNWKNVNRPKDPRTWFEKMIGKPHPDKVTKGVRKLREKDAQDLRHVALRKTHATVMSSDTSSSNGNLNTKRSLEDIQSVGSDDMGYMHDYPPQSLDTIVSTSTLAPSYQTNGEPASGYVSRSRTMSSLAASTRSHISTGVVDWQRRTPGTARWERTLWKKLDVGDIVLLRDNDQVPADIVVLNSSDPDGVCYVETKNLDGETNLKPRRSLKGTSSIQSEEDLEHANFVLDAEPPQANLYTFNGVLKYTKSEPGQSGQAGPRIEAVTINELLLRGCSIRNTDWIIGLVVFTGADTKILLNGGDTPSKRSKIERETNFNVIMNFIVLIILCGVTGLANGLFLDKNGTSAQYYEQGAETSSSTALDAIITFVSCLVAFQNIVPISLYISIEIVKTIQAYFIFQDIDMYYAPLDTTCVPKTWNISDDLGQIEYIFSDKTGTLTQNVMEFQRCSVNGLPYGEGVTEAMKGADKRAGRGIAVDPALEVAELAQTKRAMVSAMTKAWKNPYFQEDKLTLLSPKLIQHLSDRSSPQRPHLFSFFRALAICHTVLPDRPDPRERPNYLIYKAESPDETALVSAARDIGFAFVARSNQSIEIEVLGQVEKYTPLRVLEFNSTRKRMSAIVRNSDGRIVLYCKGADSVINARLAKDHDPELKASTHRDLDAFANGGLRTLLVAYRYLGEEEYFDWVRLFDAASAAVTDREEEIEKASDMIEHSLTILGATALEDKLQEGVPDTIEMLHRAGIKLWILTGDKLQTAIEIGFSCNVLTSSMEVMILSADSPQEARNQIEGGLNKIASTRSASRHEKRSSDTQLPSGFAVVIDGDTLRYALSEDLKPLFLALGTQCDTVVCCRVSPAQKALTVKLVKEGRQAMTLAIGDGANDVAMIQEAHVGCGLLGHEGSQAAMSADYAFAQFRFLAKLLLVHGRWSYIRVAEMHANFFYKNVIWTLAMFWFLFFNSFDATYLFEYTFILLDNLVFTSLPVITLGAFDQDVNAKASLAFPQLYKRGVLGLEYTRTKFWLYMLDGLYQSAIVYFIPYLVWSTGLASSWTGRDVTSLGDFGTTAAVSALIAANIYVGMNTKYWTVVTWLVICGSVLLPFLWIAIYSAFTTPTLTGESGILFSLMNFWATALLSVMLAIGPRFVINFVHQAFFPLDKDLVREMWVAGDLKEQLGLRRQRDKESRGGNRTGSGSEALSYHSSDDNVPLSSQNYASTTTLSPSREEAGPDLFAESVSRLPSPRPQIQTHRSSSVSVPLSYYSPSAIPSPTPSPMTTNFPLSPAHSSDPLSFIPTSSHPPPSQTVEVPWSQLSSRSASSPHVAPVRSPSGAGSEYEMRVRSPRSPPPEQATPSGYSMPSDSSFMTAVDEQRGVEDDTSTIRGDGRRESQASSFYSYTGQAL